MLQLAQMTAGARNSDTRSAGSREHFQQQGLEQREQIKGSALNGIKLEQLEQTAAVPYARLEDIRDGDSI